MHPEIAVILPFQNAETTLDEAVQSIVNQTFPDFELLLIDNNSADNSRNIAREWVKKDHRISLLEEKKPGVAHAMNCGLKNAGAPFLARMDADDISHPERLKEQLHFLKKNPGIDLVGCHVSYIPHHKNTRGFQRFVKWVNSFHSSEKIALNRFIEIPVVNPTILFRKEIYNALGGCLQGDFPEDYEMQLRYLDKGVRMAKISRELLLWQDFASRLTRTDTRYSTEAFFRVKASFFKKWSEKNNPFHPVIWVWGAGRKTRRYAKILEKEKIRIEGYIDIVKNKTSQKTTLHFSEIPDPGKMFIVPMVAKWGAREQINDFLVKANYTEGKDFIMMR